ncbi:IS3 family transposase [Pimelobacter simplex]|uniref:IS3 family transposase n=1 Tax=Nocardioides simplex TaxID=2045 RepID=UPI002150034F|nr:IS3 family transposase [Pimelobacter simplex]UUW89638.1 IS3 family transposase [Pimelobacter simplex]UUW90619.1 IS3 family transposase [Pimelobacter simplex]UUW92516.1 IS3 family transposase [Pimelobacter simplex]UUW92536.1 IS3 family transposase [Pimelobacter simplex]UUW92565.1 IS3 family transposase [Pimelobacter simplex]
MPEKRRKFTPEFKDEAVKMVIESSRSIAEVAREIHVNEGTLGNWCAKYREANPEEESPLSISERARLRELESEVRELRMRNEFLGKSGGLLRPGVSVSAKYEFIDAQKAHYPVVKMCAWAGVSRSGFYDWADRPASATAQRRERLKAVIEAVFDDSDATYGYRRIHASLGRMGEDASPELVRGLMRELGLVPCQPRPSRPTTTIAGDAAAVPDLLGRDFTAHAPGTKLVSDITYIGTDEGWLYLATVIDCATKACIGYAMADHMRTSLVVEALDMAARNYTLESQCVIHSDRGTQYMSDEFARAASRLDLRRSVGRTGICFDNALAESFNAAVKVERVNRVTYPTRDEARKDVARYIEFRYNRLRLHSALGYRTPQEVHDEYCNQQQAA